MPITRAPSPGASRNGWLSREGAPPMGDRTRGAFAFAGWRGGGPAAGPPGGGPAAALRRLGEAQGDEVVSLTLDVGQQQDLDAVREAALEAGAVRAHVMDVRDALALE